MIEDTFTTGYLKCLYFGDKSWQGNTSSTVLVNFLRNDDTAKQVTPIPSASCALHVDLAGFCARSTIVAGLSHVLYFN